MLNLHDYIVKADREATIRIKSGCDLYSDSTMAAVRRVLSQYDLRDLQKGEQTGFEQNPEDFPHAGVIRVSELVAKVGKVPDDRFALRDVLSLSTLIPQNLLKVECDTVPEKVEEDPTPVMGMPPGENPKDVEVPGAQDMVGPNRVKQLLKDIEEVSKKRAEEQAEKLKRIVLDHLGMMEMFESSVRKGFYSCLIDGSGKLLESDGPFEDVPAGNRVRNSKDLEKIVEEISRPWV